MKDNQIAKMNLKLVKILSNEWKVSVKTVLNINKIYDFLSLTSVMLNVYESLTDKEIVSFVEGFMERENKKYDLIVDRIEIDDSELNLYFELLNDVSNKLNISLEESSLLVLNSDYINLLFKNIQRFRDGVKLGLISESICKNYNTDDINFKLDVLGSHGFVNQDIDGNIDNNYNLTEFSYKDDLSEKQKEYLYAISEELSKHFNISFNEAHNKFIHSDLYEKMLKDYSYFINYSKKEIIKKVQEDLEYDAIVFND